MGRRRPRPTFALKLRIAISREHARRESRFLDRLSLAWDNAVRPRLVQVSAGLAGSVVLGSVALLLGVVAAPQPVLANDEPLGAITAPHIYIPPSRRETLSRRMTPRSWWKRWSTPMGASTTSPSSPVPRTEAVKTQVADQLLGSVFQPASAFGVPVRGRVVVTYSGISVHG